MNHLDTFIIDLALIMAAASVVTLVFKRFKLPVVLGYILAGFLISPNFVYLPTVVELDNVETWANIGIVFLMFGLGLEFSFAKLKTVGHSAIVTAITVMCGMIPGGFVVGRILGFDSMDSIFLGCMLSMSSTMVILKSFEEYNLKKKKFASVVLGALVIEDILGIFMLVVLTTISASRNADGSDTVLKLGLMLLYLAAWVLLGILIIPTLLRKTKKFLNDESLVILSVGICLSMVVIAYLIGFSEALGAFVGGSILAGTVSAERIDKLFTPIKDMFGAVFFVSVGMMIVPEMLGDYIVPILVITIITILGQMFFSTLGILISGQGLNTAVRGGMSMVQIGEFSFIVATLGNNLDVTGDFLFPVVVCVSIITTIFTPVSMKNSERVYEFLDRKIPSGYRAVLKRYTRDTGDEQETNDWALFMKRYAVRTLLTTMMLFIVYRIGTKYIKAFAVDKFTDAPGLAIATVVTVILMIPFISLMWYDRSTLFKKLWLASRYNRLPLISLRVLRMIIAMFMFVLVLDQMLGISKWILIPVSLILVVIIGRSEYLKGRSIKMEMRFVANMNERILHRRKMERTDDKKWLGKTMYVVEFALTHPGLNTTVRELHDTRMLDTLIIKISRDGQTIKMPGPDEKILEGDVITVLGRKDKLENYIMALSQSDDINEPDSMPVTLREYVYGEVFSRVPPEDQIMLCVISVDKDTPFAGKSIKNSEFKETYGGFIIAIERGDLSIPDPSIEMIMEDGDVVWALGDKSMADKLLQDGLMQ